MLVGHKKTLDYLVRAYKKGTLSHAYVFYGPQKTGKKTVALEFVRRINCRDPEDEEGTCGNCVKIRRNMFPDLYLIHPTEGSRETGIGAIRDLRRALALSAHSSPLTSVIIDGAEYLTHEASSALLKTLEEPKRPILFILITADIGRVPETIISRAVSLSFLAVSPQEIAGYLVRTKGILPSDAEILAKRSLGRPGLAIELAEAKENHPLILLEKRVDAIMREGCGERFSFVEELFSQNGSPELFLESLTVWARDILMQRIGCQDHTLSLLSPKRADLRYDANSLVQFLKGIQKTIQIIKHTNVNQKLSLEALLLEF